MTTASQYLNATSGRILGVQDIKDRFFDYLNERITLANEYSLGDRAFVLGGEIDVTRPSYGLLSLDFTNNALGKSYDNQGNIILAANSSFKEDFSFGEEVGETYYIGLQREIRPKDFQINPKSGIAEYTSWEEELGFSGAPDTVTDNGDGTITLRVDGFFLDSDDMYNGRTATVWLNNISENATIERPPVQSAIVSQAGHGDAAFVTINDLGQNTISTTASDYTVFVGGPITTLQSLITFIPYIVYLGTFVVNSFTWDNSGQPVVEAKSWYESVISGIGQDLRPSADNTYDLGTASYRWGAIYTSDLNFTGSLVPATDASANLGDGPYSFLRTYTYDLTVDNIYRKTASSRIGFSTSRFPAIWAEDINTLTLSPSPTDGDGVTTNFNPSADGVYDLGKATYQWADLFLAGTINADRLYLDTVNNCKSDLAPEINGNYDLGSGLYYWGHTYTRSLTLSNVAGLGVQGNINPSINNNYSIGTTTYYWEYIYANYLRYKTDSTSFDNYSDLDLIEAYKPTGEIVKMRKGGEDRLVQKGDPSTLPWPILADKDPNDDNFFIDANDAICFLLGGIKQMYQLHKKEIAEIKEKLLN